MYTTTEQNRTLFQAICPGSLWARDNRWLLSRVQRLAGPARGGDKGLLSRLEAPTGTKGWPFIWLVASTGTKGPRSLLSQLEPPTGTKDPLLSRLVSPTRTKGLGPPYLLPSTPPEPFCSLVSCCSWLGREEFLLIFFTTFVKIFDSPSIHRR